jgi:PAS domain S-box-containing protein
MYLGTSGVAFSVLLLGGQAATPAGWMLAAMALIAAASLLAAYRHHARAMHARNLRLEQEASEREQARQALLGSEHQLRLIADALPMTIAYVDADGRVRFANLAAARWFDGKAAELPGRAVRELLTPSLLAQVRQPMEAALSGQRVDFDLAVGAPGPERRRISATLVPHAEANGSVAGFYAFVQDVTERARIQEELHRQHDQLAHAARVSTLGEMATALAHELNQPLTAVLSNAHAALRLCPRAGDGRMPEEVREALLDIASDAARAGEIIRRLRQLVRKDGSKIEPLDVNQAIRGIETLIRAAALEGDVSVRLDLSPGLLPCAGDMVQVQQVALNLVRNGIDAMRGLPKAERRLVISSRHENDAVVVSVTDSGPPLPAEALPRLFEPFYSTKQNGLGMGLSISRSIVHAHGGTIEARPNPRGLSVRFALPVVRVAQGAWTHRLSA